MHPTKKEIRFNEPFAVEDMVAEAVTESLRSAESVASVDAKATDVVSSSTTFEKNETKAVEKEMERESGLEEEQVDVKNLLETLRQDVNEDVNDYIPDNSRAEAPSQNHPNHIRSLDIEAMQIVGIVLDTYIIATLEDTVYLIDQHAAHERIMYERFLAEYKSRQAPAQRLLVPLQISVSAPIEATSEEWMEHLERMGYDIEPFGDRVFILREVPAFLKESESEEFLRKFFIELEEKPDIHDFATLEKIIMQSCKSAVKGGDRLHTEEIRSLLKDLGSCENPYSCPHGRPVFVKMTRYDLERMFKRA